MESTQTINVPTKVTKQSKREKKKKRRRRTLSKLEEQEKPSIFSDYITGYSPGNPSFSLISKI